MTAETNEDGPSGSSSSLSLVDRNESEEVWNTNLRSCSLIRKWQIGCTCELSVAKNNSQKIFRNRRR